MTSLDESECKSSIDNKRRDGLLVVPISGSNQPRVSVKHIHPFWVKGVKLSDALIF